MGRASTAGRRNSNPFYTGSYVTARQLAGRKDEVWGAESGADKLLVLKTE
jgi:streptogramin lyase